MLQSPLKPHRRGWLRHGSALLMCASLTISPAVAQSQSQGAGVGDGRVSDFYTWTNNAPTKPGVMLRSEPLPAELGLSEAGEQQRILYTSTDGISGKGITTVSGAVFYPKGKPPKGGWPIIAWAHGTVGIADICAPSWAGRIVRDQAYLNEWLKRGYAIVATDYQGLGTPGTHPYIQTRPEAYSILDSARAVQAADTRLAHKVVVVGQSQGGGAAFATAAIQPSYAPDVGLLGAVATGTPYITPQALAKNGGDVNKVDPTLAYLFFLGWTATEKPAVNQLFAEKAQPVANTARTGCVFEVEENVKLAGLTRATTINPVPFLAMAPRLLSSLQFATLRPEVPVFLGTGDQDVDVPTEGQRALVRDSCAAGGRIEYHEYAGKDHSGAFSASLSDALKFVERVVKGTATSGNCASLRDKS